MRRNFAAFICCENFLCLLAREREREGGEEWGKLSTMRHLGKAQKNLRSCRCRAYPLGGTVAGG